MMGIFDLSVMRGRRVLPGVGFEKTSFGTEFSFAWHSVPTGGDVYLKNTAAHGVIGTYHSDGVYSVSPSGDRSKIFDTSFEKNVAVDSEGNFYLSHYYGRLWKVSPSGTTLIDKTAANQLSDHAVWAGDRWVYASGRDELECVSSDCDQLWLGLYGNGYCRGLAHLDGVILEQRENLFRGLDLNGNILWSDNFGWQTPPQNCVGVSGDNFVAAYGYGGGNATKLVARDAQTGAVVWTVPDIYEFSAGGIDSSLCECLTTDRFGDVYIVLGYRTKDVLKFSASGTFIGSAMLSGVIESGTPFNNEWDPRSLAVDNDGAIYIGYNKGDVIKLNQS